MVPLIAFVLFGLYIRREAERIRAEDLRPRVVVKLKLAGPGMATPAEVRMRRTIEDEIENLGLGSITDTGSGEGWATIQVAVVDPGVATEQIRGLLRDQGVTDGVVETPTTAP
jgi:hypothetical protein